MSIMRETSSPMTEYEARRGMIFAQERCLRGGTGWVYDAPNSHDKTDKTRILLALTPRLDKL